MPATPAGVRTVVMGICNVTPDSFSDGGRYLDARAAIEHGLRMAADGADLVDVGGESTRPGAARVPVDEELARVLPVTRALTAAGVRVSIDTMRAEVARAAIDAGATLVKRRERRAGRSGHAAHRRRRRRRVRPHALAGPQRGHGPLRRLRRRRRRGRHGARDRTRRGARRRHPRGPDHPRPRARVRQGGRPQLGAPPAPRRPGALGHRLLVGASRKRFLGSLLRAPDGTDRPAAERDAATAAITAIAAAAGVWGVRVHDVRASADARRRGRASGRADRRLIGGTDYRRPPAGRLPSPRCIGDRRPGRPSPHREHRHADRDPRRRRRRQRHRRAPAPGRRRRRARRAPGPRGGHPGGRPASCATRRGRIASTSLQSRRSAS